MVSVFRNRTTQLDWQGQLRQNNTTNNRRIAIIKVVAILLCTLLLQIQDEVCAQDFLEQPFLPNNPTQQNQQPDTPQNIPNRVAAVRIVGNQRVPDDQVLAKLRTRANRVYDRDLVQSDARVIMQMRYFQNVKTFAEPTAQGTIVTFEVQERPVVGKVEILGNRYLTDRQLLKELDLKTGMPLDIYAVKMARQKLKNYYLEKGYGRSDVTILEGDKLTDQNVVLLVHEDEPQKVKSLKIVGNRIVSEARLKSFLKSKASILRLIGGTFSRQKLEQDKEILTTYYHGLGFFNVRIGTDVIHEENSSWLRLLFIIDEGPRFTVRNVSFVGQQKYDAQQLRGLAKLHSSQHFSSPTMRSDEKRLQDLYGSQGHIAAEVNAEVLFLEDSPQVDLVYRIAEGPQYRVGRVNVEIEGGHGITKKQVILNRIGLKPGDVIDMRKVRASEVRLARSQLFTPQGGGAPPKLMVKPRADGGRIAEGPRTQVRYQSPDTETIWVDINIR